MKNNSEKSQIGVWMDHESAKIIHLNGKLTEIKAKTKHHLAGKSGSVTRLGNYRATNNEAHMHNREINNQHEFYKEIYHVIEPYQEVIVFGPSTAPNEFHNYILKKIKGRKNKIKIEKSDYMTDSQMLEFAGNYFLNLNLHPDLSEE